MKRQIVWRNEVHYLSNGTGGVGKSGRAKFWSFSPKVIVGLHTKKVEILPKNALIAGKQIWRGLGFFILNSLLFGFLRVMNRLPIMWEQHFFS